MESGAANAKCALLGADPIRVLLVEDSAADAVLLLDAIRQMGAEVDARVEHDGARLDQALEERFDIVVSDYRLPGVSGLEIAARVRDLDPDVPVVLVSGVEHPDVIAAAMLLHIRDFVIKDDLRRLAQVVLREATDYRQRRSARVREAALRARVAEAQALADRIVEHIHYPMLVLRGTGLVVERANAAFDRLFGPPLVGAAFEEVGAPALLDLRLQSHAFRACLRGVPFATQELRVHVDGETRWFILDARPISAEQGGALLVSLVDFTEQRAARQQAADEQRLQSIGRLATGVAHDFNNVLTVIASHADFIRAALLSAGRSVADVDVIEQATVSAARFTAQLLSLGRQRVPGASSTSIAASIRAVERVLRGVLGEDIALDIRLSSEAHVGLSTAQMEQVLLNLVANARDAMPSGGALRLDVSEVITPSPWDPVPSRFVLLEVTDTGVGMDEATQHRVFEPFFTATTDGPGGGLGLATVLGLVNQAGGFLDVDSTVGAGATFRLHLPPVSAQSVRRSASANVSSGGGETILFVEDQPDVRQAVARVLGHAGYDVLVAQTAEEALLLWHAHASRIRLLVADAVMPRLGGRELAARIRAEAPLPVLLVSGYASERPGDVAFDVHFLPKPFSPDELLAAVRHAIDDELIADQAR